MPNQPAGWPITGTTAITPIRGTQGPPPNRANASEKVPWHLTEFPSFTKNSISVAVHIFPIHQYQLFKFYMDFMVCNMHFWEEILKVLHPSSSNTPKEIPGGETPTFAIKLRLRILWTLRKGLLGPEAEPAGWTQRISQWKLRIQMKKKMSHKFDV